MKKLLIFLTILIAIVPTISAQDIVILRNGEEREAKIKEVGVNTIEYVRYDNMEGPIYEVLKSEVFKIKYANGVEDVFEELTSTPDKANSKEGTFIDNRDNTSYRWVDIGDHRWMGENLKYNDGKSPCPQSEENECDECGRYYTFDDALVACPEGWHLPSDKEWIELEIEAGMKESEAAKFGWRGTSPGQAKDIVMKGSTGLNLRMCGYVFKTNVSKRNPKYSDNFIGEQAFYWTATEEGSYGDYAIFRHLKNRASIEKKALTKNTRYPVRCVKDDDNQ